MQDETDTKIIKIDRDGNDPEALRLCADTIRRGGLVCFPTETVYGLGANAFDAAAVARIFEAKGRPGDNPLIVHIDGYAMLPEVSRCDERQRDRLLRLGEACWPGPVTMIVPKKETVPESVTCGLPTVGIRMPAHPVARKLIGAAGVPIAAPSANLSGRPSPSRAAHVIQDLMGRVDIILDGGDCEVGVESTVLDISGEEPLILRPGAVTLRDVRRILGTGSAADWHAGIREGETPRSPGMKYKHYAPKARVLLYDGEPGAVREAIRAEAEKRLAAGERIGVLTTDGNLSYYKGLPDVLSLGARTDAAAQAANLFRLLRRFDELGTETVLAETVPQEGVGDAVMNRLFRAAGGCLIRV